MVPVTLVLTYSSGLSSPRPLCRVLTVAWFGTVPSTSFVSPPFGSSVLGVGPVPRTQVSTRRGVSGPLSSPTGSDSGTSSWGLRLDSPYRTGWSFSTTGPSTRTGDGDPRKLRVVSPRRDARQDTNRQGQEDMRNPGVSLGDYLGPLLPFPD